jgi:hypothetical protein
VRDGLVEARRQWRMVGVDGTRGCFTDSFEKHTPQPKSSRASHSAVSKLTRR